MKAKFCLPIIKETSKEVIKTLEKNNSNFEMFEVWIDYINDPIDVILSLIQDLANKYTERIIVVCHRKNGETMRMSFEQKEEILLKVSGTKMYLDLDISKEKQELDFIKSNKLNIHVITSFHDYEKTPRTSVLVKVIKGMELYNPTLYKISTFCETEKRAIALLHLLLDLKEQKKRCIVLGMGKLGAVTRIFGSLWGNEIIYAPLSKADASAPDQLTKQQLETLFSIINI